LDPCTKDKSRKKNGERINPNLTLKKVVTLEELKEKLIKKEREDDPRFKYNAVIRTINFQNSTYVPSNK
jgi:hypothetical protein